MTGSLHLCDDYPSFAVTSLAALPRAPSLLFYLAVFFLLVRLVWAAERSGPFEAVIPPRLRVLGWTLVVGGYLANAIEDGAETALVIALTKPGTNLHPSWAMAAFEGLVTLPVLTLLTGLGC